MKKNIYTVIENQIRTDGSKGLLYDHYESREQAFSKYHTVLAAAAISGIPYHEAVILGLNEGIVARNFFDRRVDEAEADETEAAE